MPYFGSHLSIAGGYAKIGSDALSIGADTFQFFTRNPRGGAVKAADPADVASLIAILDEKNFGPLIAHGPYTLNPCSSKPEVREFARLAMADDLRRLDEILPGRCVYNFHPGSHVGQGIEKGIELIAELLNEILPDVKSTPVLLETMSGKGSEVGGRFEELAEIISRVNCPEKVGVCLDSCHVWSAGYDVVNDLDGVLAEFDRVVGLEKLLAVHVNDSMTPYAAHKDRHENLGFGTIGEAAFARFAACEKFKNLPMCLETPQETLAGWSCEIARLRAYANGEVAKIPSGAAAKKAPTAKEVSSEKKPAVKKSVSGKGSDEKDSAVKKSVSGKVPAAKKSSGEKAPAKKTAVRRAKSAEKE